MIIKGIYQHYKGNYYEVVYTAHHAETLEEMVVYRALYDNFAVWVRPLKIFTEYITFNKNKLPRFKFISSNHSNPSNPPLP